MKKDTFSIFYDRIRSFRSTEDNFDDLSILITDIKKITAEHDKYQAEWKLFRKASKHFNLANFKYVISNVKLNDYWFENVLWDTTQYKQMENTKYIIDNYADKIKIENGLFAASYYGNIEFIDLFYSRGARDIDKCLIEAAKSDSYEACKHFVNTYDAIDYMEAFISVGGYKKTGIKCLKFFESLVEIPHNKYIASFNNLCKHGNPCALKYIMNKTNIDCNQLVNGFKIACKSGNFEVMLLLSQYIKKDPHPIVSQYLQADLAQYLTNYITCQTKPLCREIIKDLMKYVNDLTMCFYNPRDRAIRLLVIMADDPDILVNIYNDSINSIEKEFSETSNKIRRDACKFGLNRYYKELIRYLRKKNTPLKYIPNIDHNLLYSDYGT